MLSSPVIPRLIIVSSIDPQHEHFSDAGTAIFFNHAKSDQPALSVRLLW